MIQSIFIAPIALLFVLSPIVCIKTSTIHPATGEILIAESDVKHQLESYKSRCLEMYTGEKDIVGFSGAVVENWSLAGCLKEFNALSRLKKDIKVNQDYFSAQLLLVLNKTEKNYFVLSSELIDIDEQTPKVNDQSRFLYMLQEAETYYKLLSEINHFSEPLSCINQLREYRCEFEAAKYYLVHKIKQMLDFVGVSANKQKGIKDIMDELNSVNKQRANFEKELLSPKRMKLYLEGLYSDAELRFIDFQLNNCIANLIPADEVNPNDEQQKQHEVESADCTLQKSETVPATKDSSVSGTNSSLTKKNQDFPTPHNIVRRKSLNLEGLSDEQINQLIHKINSDESRKVDAQTIQIQNVNPDFKNTI